MNIQYPQKQFQRWVIIIAQSHSGHPISPKYPQNHAHHDGSLENFLFGYLYCIMCTTFRSLVRLFCCMCYNTTVCNSRNTEASLVLQRMSSDPPQASQRSQPSPPGSGIDWLHYREFNPHQNQNTPGFSSLSRKPIKLAEPSPGEIWLGELF